MWKKILLISVVIIIISSFLSGCISKTDEDRFIGTWETEDESMKLVIYSDGTCEFIGSEGTWEIKDGNLWMVLRFTGGKNTMSYNYSFSDGDKTLTLMDTSERTWIYTKQ
jgi:hypothetical protein